MTTTVLTSEAGRYKSLLKAAEELGVSRFTVGWYMRQFSFEDRKFPLDRNKYMTVEEFEHIKALRDAMAEREREREREREQ